MSSSAHLRLLGAAIFLLLLAPLTAFHDDDIRTVAFLFETYDDAVCLGPHVSPGNHDVAGTHAQWRFDDVEPPPMFTLEIAGASGLLASTSEAILSDPPLTAPVGRAPPAA